MSFSITIDIENGSPVLNIGTHKFHPIRVLDEYKLIPKEIRLLANTIMGNMFLVEMSEEPDLFNGYWVVFDNNSSELIGDIVKILNTLRYLKVIHREKYIRITHPSYSSSSPNIKNKHYVMSPL